MADLYALHWNAVTNANQYIVEVNPGGSGWATLGTTSGTQYTVVNTSTAYQSNIKYRVKAKDTTGVYDDSPYSNELSITYYSITNTLTNCTSDNIQQMVANGFTYNSIITVSDGYIIGSDNWNITIGGTSDKTKGTLSSDGKTLNVAILSANGNIVITASAALEAPAAPTITLTGSTISWAAVTGATKYGIAATKDGITQQAETVNLSYDLSTWSALTEGTWTVSVKSGKEDAWSTPSNSVTYTVQNKLATPTITIDGDTLNITDVENAQKYKIYANGELKTTIPKAVQPFTLTLNYKSDIGLFNYGRVKIGSVPTSDNDYDYQAVSTHIENKAGSNLGTTVTVNNVLKYYSWATNPTSGSTNWQTPVEHTEQSYDLCYFTCLTGDTLVTMADNNVKRLDAIEVGDYVLSFDFDNKILIPRKVIYTDKNEMKSHTEYDKWTFEDGTEIKTVHRHEFYNLEAQRMKYMDEWSVGEHTYKIDGTMPKLISHKIVEETVRHYKITLEGSTNYFANGLLTGDRNCPKNITLNILCNEKGK